MSSHIWTGRATRPLAVGLGLGLAASALTLTTSSTASAVVEPIDVTIVATNDFHGRLLPARDAGGAAKLASAVDSVRADHPDAIFAAAGDLIGASTFESFIQQDKPTIDALNEAGLDVSAVGNHEFDQGYDDLVNRVMAPESEANPFGGAEWAYIGANVKMRDTGSDALDPTYVHTVGEGADAVDVGFIGAVTEHLPELVSPDGISEIVVTDIVDEVNAEADALEAEGVDVIVMLVHEGAPTTDCTKIGALSAESDFGSIVKGVDSSVDAIVSGHTHLAYDCKLGSAEAPAQLRPVVSAGQYGFNINRVSFDVDPVAGSILGVDTEIINVARTANPFTEDPAVKQIVDDAVAVSDELGAAKLGEIAGPFTRAKRADGTTENRGGESTVGNLVGEVQRWATGTDIGFMNPGGLRDDIVGLAQGGYPATLTYKQAAVVQPFANTLVKMDLTGAQLKSVLEEQWQPAGASRPFLHLGASKGFEWTYDPAAAKGEHITGMWLDGEMVEPDATYSVTANSFLASGGDSFTTFAQGANPTDTGQSDLQAMVDYMEEFGSDAAVEVDYSQHSVGVTFPEGAPATYAAGDTLAMDLSSLLLAPTKDVFSLSDDEVEVRLDGRLLGTFDVDNTVVSDTADENGTASVSLTLPVYAGTPESVTVVGTTTGTSVEVPVAFETGPDAVVEAKRRPKGSIKSTKRLKVTAIVSIEGEPAAGEVTFTGKGVDKTVELNKNGKAKTKVGPFKKGTHTILVSYGDYSDILRFKVR